MRSRRKGKRAELEVARLLDAHLGTGIGAQPIRRQVRQHRDDPDIVVPRPWGHLVIEVRRRGRITPAVVRKALADAARRAERWGRMHGVETLGACAVRGDGERWRIYCCDDPETPRDIATLVQRVSR